MGPLAVFLLSSSVWDALWHITQNSVLLRCSPCGCSFKWQTLQLSILTTFLLGIASRSVIGKYLTLLNPAFRWPFSSIVPLGRLISRSRYTRSATAPEPVVARGMVG